MKQFKLLLILFLPFSLFIGGNFWLMSHHVTPIMMYHHVSDQDNEQGRNFVDITTFEWQMKFLKEKKYQVISFEEFVDSKLNEKKLPRKSVVITFDDGYDDNFNLAYPILKKYGFPATIFMPYNRIGQEGYLSGEQLKELIENNISIQSHGLSELYLPDYDEIQVMAEIRDSKTKLEELLGNNVRIFSYPIGGFSEAIKDYVKKYGYDAACTTNRGYDRFNKDLYEINRISFSSKDDKQSYLKMKLSGYYNLLRKTKSPN